MVDKKSKLKSAIEVFAVFGGIGGTIGAVVGFGLSFISLSPMFVGGIIELSVLAAFINDIRLDRYIRRIFPGLKQSVIEKSLRRGLIKVDDCKAKSSDRVNSGQTITLKHLDHIENANSDRKCDERLIELLKENILYEDEYILAINKPAGVIVQGGIKVKISITTCLIK